jgi:S1-C subfamily serine protease
MSGNIKIYLVVLAFSLSGCSGTLGQNFNSSIVQKIQNNTTTQKEILNGFGPPFKKGMHEGYIMWTYQFDKWDLLGSVQSKDLIILFDENNIVRAHRYTGTGDFPQEFGGYSTAEVPEIRKPRLHKSGEFDASRDRSSTSRLPSGEDRQRQEQAKEESRTRKKQLPQLGTGSGFFVSKMGHVITNAHVVHNCNKVTIGDNANKQVPAELINTDRSNDLALLKLSTLEMASAESKSLIQKLGIVVVPLASKGLLRSEDVRLGEKVLVAGYPFVDLLGDTIKVTSGIVSATRGPGDNSGQFQLDAAIQPGNSGGPIYDIGGNIVGVVISQLDKRMMEKAIGSLPENVNFGIKASTVRQFLMSSGLPSKKAERTEEKSTEQLAEIAKNQALMVMCLK